MSIPSLRANIATTKVRSDSGSWSQSQFFLNSDDTMCPVPNGQDLAGRPVGEYSFYTKKAGCNSALDRLNVENEQRPRYTSYVGTNAAGIGGYYNGYENKDHRRGYENRDRRGGYRENYVDGSNLTEVSVRNAENERKFAQYNTGKFGLVSTEAILPSNTIEQRLAIGSYVTQDEYARNAQVGRDTQNAYIGFTSSDRLRAQNYPQGLINPVKYSVNPNLNYAALSPVGSYYANEKQFKSCAM